MKFEQALQAMREGKIVHLAGCDIHYKIDEKFLVCRDVVVNNRYWCEDDVTPEEILAEDWEVICNDRSLEKNRGK